MVLKAEKKIVGMETGWTPESLIPTISVSCQYGLTCIDVLEATDNLSSCCWNIAVGNRVSQKIESYYILKYLILNQNLKHKIWRYMLWLHFCQISATSHDPMERKSILTAPHLHPESPFTIDTALVTQAWLVILRILILQLSCENMICSYRYWLHLYKILALPWRKKDFIQHHICYQRAAFLARQLYLLKFDLSHSGY